MIEMQVVGVALDTKSGSPIIILNDKENRRALPIWIGSAEANAIIREIEKVDSERPMTHDLICNILGTTGVKVKKVEIDDFEEGTFFATLFLVDEKGNEYKIDSRPSDAIAIAIRVKAAIFVSCKVVSAGTVSTDEDRDHEETEKFKQFVQDIKPSDFIKKTDDQGENLNY